MPLLDSNFYPAIRHAIDQGVTEAALPDARIEECLPEAEEWVARAVSVEDLEGDDLTHAQRAARYYTAYLLCATVNIPKSDAVGGIGASYTREVETVAAKERRLLGRAQSELAFLTEEDEITVRPPWSGSATNQPVW